jgi:hypothetical protein
MSNEFEMRRRIDGLLFPIGKICRTRTFRCVQQASDRKPSDELGQFINERLVNSDAERHLREQLAVPHENAALPHQPDGSA